MGSGEPMRSVGASNAVSRAEQSSRSGSVHLCARMSRRSEAGVPEPNQNDLMRPSDNALKRLNGL